MPGDDERKVSKRGDRPGEFGVEGQDRIAVYQGERPVDGGPPPAPITTMLSGGNAKKSFKALGITRKEGIFLRELSSGRSRGVLVDAYRAAFPTSKASDATMRQKASRMYRSISAKLGDDADFELMGIGRTAVMANTKRLMEAKMVKVFIKPKTGQVIESEAYEDNAVQLGATKLAAEMQGMVKKDGAAGGGGQVIVNIVQYAPADAPPWPGGGRS